jgi:hypothetical protein
MLFLKKIINAYELKISLTHKKGICRRQIPLLLNYFNNYMPSLSPLKKG